MLSSVLTSSACTSEDDSMREEKNRLDPVDMEFDVGPGFLFLSDSQEEPSSPEHGERSDENAKKPLEEATGSKPKEHAIDEVSDASSDDDSCVIVEDTEVQKDPKIQERVVDQEQGIKKTAEISTKILSPAAQPVRPVEHPVRPKAVVKPMVCTDLPTYAVVEVHLSLSKFIFLPVGDFNIFELKLTLIAQVYSTENMICIFKNLLLFVMYWLFR